MFAESSEAVRQLSLKFAPTMKLCNVDDNDIFKILEGITMNTKFDLNLNPQSLLNANALTFTPSQNLCPDRTGFQNVFKIKKALERKQKFKKQVIYQ